MYLGLQLGQEDLRRAFGRQPLEMSGMSYGWIIKYPYFYIKVYPIVHSLEYEVQYYEYFAYEPYKVDRVKTAEIYMYGTYIRQLFS